MVKKNKKPILMIHDMREDYIEELPLSKFTLTFDDALYSQFYYWDQLKSIDTDKIFFITPSILNPVNSKQSTLFPTSNEAHRKFFELGITEDFMNIDQIKFLKEQEQVYLGAHGYYHRNINTIKKFKDKINFIKEDTEKLLEWFQKNLNFTPDKYCYPYNESNEIYQAILKGYGFKEFFGGYRKDINEIKLF